MSIDKKGASVLHLRWECGIKRTVLFVKCRHEFDGRIGTRYVVG